MALSACPLTAFADDSVYTGGLCEHHMEHNEECGYIEAVEESPCTHEHTEECYRLVTECVHEHTTECYPAESVSENTATPSEPGEAEPTECTHECSEESGCVTKELDCEHEHNEECGYVPAKEGSPCGYWCEICAGETEESDKADATDETDEIEIDNTDKTEEPEKTDETDETEESEKSFSPMSARAITPTKPGGDGTKENPYKIGTAAELYWFARLVNGDESIIGDETKNTTACAVLTTDITINDNVLNADGNLNSGTFTEWTPIGSYDIIGEKAYTGTFDGNGHTISGLYVDSDARYIGLFGYIGNGATVKNVGIEDSYINESESPYTVSVGAICGYNSGTVENCYNTGTVSGESIGGVCGYNDEGEISNCYNTGNVSGSYVAGGVCGISSGTVENCYNTGTVSGEYAGGVCGISYGTENCYNTGIVSGEYAGGVCGISYGTVTNCYNTGAVSSTGTVSGSGLYAGGVCGWNIYGGTIENCYYLEGTASYGVGSDSGTATITALTVKQMTGSAAETYMAGLFETEGVWGIKEGISTMAAVEVALSYYPYLIVFGPESAPVGQTESVNIMAKDEEGYFLIYSKEDLEDFAAIVNGTLSAKKQAAYEEVYTGVDFENPITNASAKLTEDIVIQEGVLKADGSLNTAETFVKWTPIGVSIDNPYTGTFDGQNHTISGMYINSDAEYIGLFGYIGSGAEVKNVGIEDSYVNGTGEYPHVGGVSGGCNGRIENCYNKGTVSGSFSVGGISGSSSGSITNCYNTGAVSSSGLFAGGICGQNMNTGKIDRCYNTGAVTGTCTGGVCGRNMNNGKIENCYNTGTVSGTTTGGSNYAGGVCGYNMDTGKIENCYNTGIVSGTTTGTTTGGVCGYNSGTVENCYNTGAVSGEYAGGVCGWNMNNGKIENCHNTGTVSNAAYAGGVCAANGGTIKNCYNTGNVSGNVLSGGVCGNNDEGEISNCYNTGTVSGGYAGGVCGWNLVGTVENCYYLEGSAETGVGLNSGTAADIEEKSQSQFSSGEVAWLLQNGQKDQVWGQEIGTDSHPKFSDEKVLKVTLMDGEDEIGAVYANAGGTMTEPDIDVGSGFYVDGWYTDSDFGGDEWDFETDTIDDDITLYADVEERKSSGGGSYSLPEGTDRDEPKDEPEEQPEYRPDEPSTPETPGFIDVDIFDWYHDGVMYATENGIMNGVGGNRFEPETELKREMLAVILWNMTDNPEPNGIAPFLDVASDKYYAKAIAWANENGVMYGYGEEFGVGEAVTREDFAAILYRYAAFKGYDTTQGGMAIREFIDFDQIADYAVEALGWAVNSGIISGMGDGTISPKATANRGQAAVMFMKFCENVIK